MTHSSPCLLDLTAVDRRGLFIHLLCVTDREDTRLLFQASCCWLCTSSDSVLCNQHHKCPWPHRCDRFPMLLPESELTYSGLRGLRFDDSKHAGCGNFHCFVCGCQLHLVLICISSWFNQKRPAQSFSLSIHSRI
jgi:hypothetical protein